MSTAAATARRTPLARHGATLRLGRRTVRAGGWRNALVVALIALGIGSAVLVAVAGRSSAVPEDAWVTERYGAVADVRIETYAEQFTFDDLDADQQAFYLEVAGRPPAPADPVGVDEAIDTILGTTTPRLAYVEQYVSQAGGVQLLALDLEDPLAEGLVAGDPVTPAPGTALISPAAARALDVAVGDQLAGDHPALEGTDVGSVRLVGTVEHPFRSTERVLALAPGALGEPTRWLVDADDPQEQRALSLAFVTPADAVTPEVDRWADIRADAVLGPERSLADRVVSSPSFIGSVVAALLLTMVGLVAAAAFATGLRRRIREVGLLGATGASPTQVRQIALGEALVLGAAGAAAGIALGLLAAWLGEPVIERVTGTRVDGLEIAVGDLLGPALIGVLAAAGAALWPAVTASRTATTTALAGRVPLRRVPTWLPVLAVTTSVVGLVVVSLAIRAQGVGLWQEVAIALGAVATALGAATLGVPLLGLGGRLADRLPVGPRLVLRDAVRQRARSGATVAALVVVLMVPVMALTSFATDRARFAEPVDTTPIARVSGPVVAGVQIPVSDAAVADATALLPVEPVTRLDVPALSGPPQAGGPWVTVTPIEQVGGASAHSPGTNPPALATPALLRAAGVDADVAAAVMAGELVVDVARTGTLSDAQRDAGRRAAQLVAEGGPAGANRAVDLLSVEPAEPALGGWLLLGPTLADRVGLTVASTTIVLELPRVLTHDEAEIVWSDASPLTSGGFVDVPTRAGMDGVARMVSLGVALVGALLVVGIAAALAATESDRDLGAMVAVGAEPRQRSRFHGLQAAYHAGLAALIAVPAALLLFAAVSRGSGERGLLVVVPWPDVTALGVGVPLLVGLLMRLAMRPIGPALDRRIG